MSDVRPGDSIAGRYRLIEELGGGGMGVVFRARDEDRDRDVAIKILRWTNPEALRRLQREARAAERLDPVRVAQVYEVGETPSGQAFLAMEYIEGRTLRALLREGQIERAEALRILREIATTLAAAHVAGLVHRDVKPDNVMVRRDGRVVLLDFGIVKQLDPSEDAARITTQLTSEGAMIGTPAYLAPEQALGQDVGPAVDQFALAVTAFELLTGRLPWSGTHVTRVLAQLLADPPPLASTLNPAIPKPFDAVLGRALAKSPEGRFPTVEGFADALEAAERGVAMPSPVSHTLDAPPLGAITPRGSSSEETGADTVHGPASTAFPPVAPKPRRSLRTVALLVGLVTLGGGALFARGRSLVVESAASHPQPAPVLAVSSHMPLACPIFAVEGMPEVGAQLGAAASSLACTRAKWYLGGADDHVLVPAALLDAPVQPRQDLWDFYRAPETRARTLEVAKARGLPSLDGTVTRSSDSWRVDLIVHAPDGGEIARSDRVEATYLELAIKNAVARLWEKAPLKPEVIDSDVARWTADPDIEAGLLELDLTQWGARADACATLRRRGAALGQAYNRLRLSCSDSEPLSDAGGDVLDESSAPALVTSANSILNAIPNAGADPLSDAEKRRVASELEAMRANETSPLGRAQIGRLAGILWALVKEPNRAHAALLSAVADDPFLLNSWFQLVYTAGGTGSADTATSLASVWDPQEPAFLRYASATQSDVLDERIRAGELAYILEPTLARIIFLGRALAEAGRAEEVRALTVTTPVDRSEPDPNGAKFLLASIDMHDAMFARALERFEAAGLVGIKALPVLADVLGRTETTAARWAAWYVAQPDDTAMTVARGTPMAMALCMHAGRALAGRCLSRIDALGLHGSKWVGGELFIAGAKRFAAGDLRGAVDAWRPIVAGSSDDLACLLPTEVFERVGEADLAARIDARKMAYRQLAGISEATPREARRAFARGDRAKATELAKSVVHAWEVADTAVPAVAEMRALLSKMGE